MKSFLAFFLFVVFTQIIYAQNTTPLYRVYELRFTGPEYTVTDNPVKDVELVTTWRHESGSPSYRVYGFFEGNGRGSAAGKFFKVRFCPTLAGKWTLTMVESNVPELQDQHKGHRIDVIKTTHKGFWLPDPESAGSRWYKRSDGSHEYIIGNTMYSFLSGYVKDSPTGNNINEEVEGNASYYNKLRFALTGDIYPHPQEKPYLDVSGTPTDNGDYSYRPNPKWFNERVDPAVETAYDRDMIADLILNGPDSYNGRSALLAKMNGNNPEPFLRYIAARYGSYPNVWICLSNEYNIRTPNYTEKQIIKYGHIIRKFLPYPTPLSVHPNQMDWETGLNSIVPWNDHVIFQNKIKIVGLSSDKMELNYWKGGGNKPVINDELAYEGAGDYWNEEEVLKAFLGAFLGGGYGSTGHKTGNKLGGYFGDGFNQDEHSVSDNLLWFREQINQNIQFWKMEPYQIVYTSKNGIWLNPFSNVSMDTRIMHYPGKEYIVGGSAEGNEIRTNLPDGSWEITRYDLVKKERKVLGSNVSGSFKIRLDTSPVVMVHFRKQ